MLFHPVNSTTSSLPNKGFTGPYPGSPVLPTVRLFCDIMNYMFFSGLQGDETHDPEEGSSDFKQVLSDIGSPDRKFYFLHMELKDTHEQVGSIGYTVLDRTPVGKIVHLGYFTYPKYWGNSYTTEARLLRQEWETAHETERR